MRVKQALANTPSPRKAAVAVPPMPCPLQQSTNKVDYFVAFEAMTQAVVQARPIIAAAARAASAKPLAAQAVRASHSVVRVMTRRATVPM